MARAWVPPHRPKVRPTAASMRGVRQAMAALYSDGPAVAFEDALAEREQWRREQEASDAAQRCLPLGAATE